MKYEYKTIEIPKFNKGTGPWNRQLDKILNRYSDKGWELDQLIIEFGKIDSVIFRRLKSE